MPARRPNPARPARSSRARRAPGPKAAAKSEPQPVSDLTPIVGANVRRFRADRGWSLQRLADESGVSRAMLGQIELEQSAPTINVLWKIASALGLPFSALLREAEQSPIVVLPRANARLVRSRDGKFSSRALFPADRPRNVEFYELRLAPRATEHADAHVSGTCENLLVAQGALELVVGAERRVLEAGDAIFFPADEPHTYRNVGAEEVVSYLVMTYPRQGI